MMLNPDTISLVSIIGRTAATNDGARVMAYPGVELRFTYSGPAPIVHLRARSDTCFFNLSVNGWPSAVIHLEIGDNAIRLPSGPAPASGWAVSLVRRTGKRGQPAKGVKPAKGTGKRGQALQFVVAPREGVSTV